MKLHELNFADKAQPSNWIAQYHSLVDIKETLDRRIVRAPVHVDFRTAQIKGVLPHLVPRVPAAYRHKQLGKTWYLEVKNVGPTPAFLFSGDILYPESGNSKNPERVFSVFEFISDMERKERLDIVVNIAPGHPLVLAPQETAQLSFEYTTEPPRNLLLVMPYRTVQQLVLEDQYRLMFDNTADPPLQLSYHTTSYISTYQEDAFYE